LSPSVTAASSSNGGGGGGGGGGGKALVTLAALGGPAAAACPQLALPPPADMVLVRAAPVLMPCAPDVFVGGVPAPSARPALPPQPPSPTRPPQQEAQEDALLRQTDGTEAAAAAAATAATTTPSKRARLLVVRTTTTTTATTTDLADRGPSPPLPSPPVMRLALRVRRAMLQGEPLSLAAASGDALAVGVKALVAARQLLMASGEPGLVFQPALRRGVPLQGQQQQQHQQQQVGGSIGASAALAAALAVAASSSSSSSSRRASLESREDGQESRLDMLRRRRRLEREQQEQEQLMEQQHYEEGRGPAAPLAAPAFSSSSSPASLAAAAAAALAPTAAKPLSPPDAKSPLSASAGPSDQQKLQHKDKEVIELRVHAADERRLRRYDPSPLVASRKGGDGRALASAAVARLASTGRASVVAAGPDALRVAVRAVAAARAVLRRRGADLACVAARGIASSSSSSGSGGEGEGVGVARRRRKATATTLPGDSAGGRNARLPVGAPIVLHVALCAPDAPWDLQPRPLLTPAAE